ncbi:MAG: class I SAM-dependent methyltransferase, partial [Sciscionella sp.]|nr:class I SAM-dependent methyltransferase [Sciscionella sp.]
RLPYADASFDLVVGHAVLDHIPDLDQAFAEIMRVLKPGGRFVFAGEPTRHGDWMARRLSRLTWLAATKVTRLPGLESWRRPQTELDESSRAAALEAVVDLHTFTPRNLEDLARRAGATQVRVTTSELLASWFGWPVRTFECAVPKERLGMRWAQFAYQGWLRLSTVDERLEWIVPRGLFYNAEVTGVRP